MEASVSFGQGLRKMRIYKNITFLYGGNRFPSHLKYQQLHEIISVHIIQVLVIYIHYKNKV